MMTAEVQGLDYRGRGVVREGGQVVFVAGALPGETVRYRITSRKKRFAEGAVTEILHPSPERTAPGCPHYAQCGGCDLQHLLPEAQRRWKEAWWQEQLARLGGGAAEKVWPVLAGEVWHYRARARLAVTGGRIGFRARGGHEVVEIGRCPVLDERLNALLPALRGMGADVQGITLHAGDAQAAVGLHGVRRADKARWQAFAAQTGAGVWADGGWIAPCDLYYGLPGYGVRIPYTPAHFTQANRLLNRAMVARAMALLQPQADERIADFFSGLGNFSLPIARLGAQVGAFEGEAEMAREAQALADAHGLAVTAARADLFAMTEKRLNALGRFDAWLLDPPRAGAQALVQAVGRKNAPGRIVYVSCDSATFARDAKILRDKGYTLADGGVADMFAHTAHLESMGLFLRK